MKLNPSEWVESALSYAQSLDGVEQSFVVVEQSSHVNLRWALTSLTTNGLSNSTSVTVGVVTSSPQGRCLGSISATSVAPEDVQRIVDLALAKSRATTPAEDAADLVAGPKDDDFSLPGEETSAAVFEKVATDLGAAFEHNRASGRELFGYAEHNLVTTWLGTSTGTRHRYVQPSGTIELNGKSHQRTRSTWNGAATRDFRDVDVLAMDAQVEQRLSWQNKKIDIPAGRYRTLLPASAVADLLLDWMVSAEARTASEGRSAFSDPISGTKLGQQLTAVPLTLFSQPDYPGLETSDVVSDANPEFFGSAFDLGMALEPTTWLDNGRLAALPSTRFGAQKAGVPLHLPVNNLIGAHRDGTGDLNDLIGTLDDGLLVTCMWYIRTVDPLTMLLTGLTRDGVYQVKNGEVVGAVSNFRWNDSPMNLLNRISGASASEGTLGREWSEYFPRIAMPNLIVEDFNMSSVSEAQ